MPMSWSAWCASRGVFLPAAVMRSHIAGHIFLKDVKAFACGCCGAHPLGPGQSGCQPKLQGRRGTKREDQPDPALCGNNYYRVFYSALGSKAFKGTCTNVPMRCPACSADGTDTVWWKYALEEHYSDQHKGRKCRLCSSKGMQG
jgi:hypothetical protein